MYEPSDAVMFPNHLANPLPIFPLDSFLPRSDGAPNPQAPTATPVNNKGMQHYAPTDGAESIKGHYFDKADRLWFILNFTHGYARFAVNTLQLDRLVRQPYSDLMDRYLARRQVTEEEFLPCLAAFKLKVNAAQRLAKKAADLRRELATAHIRNEITEQQAQAAKHSYNSQHSYKDTTISIRRYGAKDDSLRRKHQDRSPSHEYEADETDSRSHKKVYSSGTT
ncbi:hypothetical protein P7C70_g8265, partial [Phenoliferia sp. Uapishka_3]